MRTKSNAGARATVQALRKRGTVIYPKVLAIMAEKANGKAYKHDFSSRAPIVGLPDGSLLIPAGSRPLWGTV